MYSQITTLTLVLLICRAYAGVISVSSDNSEITDEDLLSLDNEETNYQLEYDYNPPASEIGIVKSLNPHLEILKLIEAALKLKGEVSSRLHSFIYNNFDLFKTIFGFMSGKLSKVLQISLFAVQLFRKLFQFLLPLLSRWNISLPQFTLNLQDTVATAFNPPRPSASEYGVHDEHLPQIGAVSYSTIGK